MSLEKLIQEPVRTVPPTAACALAAQIMRDDQIGALVVAEDGVPLGIVTDRDLVLRVMAEGLDPTRVEVRNVMSRHPAFLSEQRSIDEAISTMREMGIRRLPVVDRHGRVKGMLSMDDVLMLMGRQLALLGEAIRNELSAQKR
jgi:CBS domain-containing protein